VNYTWLVAKIRRNSTPKAKAHSGSLRGKTSRHITARPKAVMRRGEAQSLLAVFQEAARELPSIHIDSEIQGGAPVVKGTRIPVHLVLRAIEQHGTLEGAIRSYPELSLDQVKDALYFARVILGCPSGVKEVPATS
jgi:uncharacterized protein (DUF433 family)